VGTTNRASPIEDRRILELYTIHVAILLSGERHRLRNARHGHCPCAPPHIFSTRTPSLTVAPEVVSPACGPDSIRGRCVLPHYCL
jgi:hypothetical protein